jgi:hypothetical protein
MSEEPPIHPSAPEVAEDGIEVARDAGTDARSLLKFTAAGRINRGSVFLPS